MFRSSASERPRRAVVLGASVAGLLAARVLSEHFDRVLVLERDPAPQTGQKRRGVPHAHQSHLCLRSGLQVIEELFPGFLGELAVAGFESYDVAGDVAWWHRGEWKPRFTSGLRAYAIGRSDLEERLRRRVVAIPNLRILWDRAVAGLDLDETGSRVVGVTLDDVRGEWGRIEADLVVDATGVGSRLPRLLAEQGFESPQEERVAIGLSCTTGIFELPASAARDWRVLFVPPSSPRLARGGTVLPLRGERFSVTLYGYRGDRASTQEAAFRIFAVTLGHPELAHALEGARLVSAIRRASVPAQIRRRYDRARLPEGLLVIGEALCRVDPASAHGMSLGAIEARSLARLLRRRRNRRDPVRGLGRAYHRAAFEATETPWALGRTVTGSAGAGGSWWARVETAYRRAVESSAARDRSVHAAYLRVWHLERPPISLCSPNLAARVLLRSAQAAWQRLPRRGWTELTAPPALGGDAFAAQGSRRQLAGSMRDARRAGSAAASKAVSASTAAHSA
jgi:2-polyprenyl-6-methoxyphenol hydroxylase-like FAD-dependent oxidoreductase